MRLLEPSRHVEAAGSRRWFLVIAAGWSKAAGRRPCKSPSKAAGGNSSKAGYTRVAQWLAATAPQ